MITRVNKDPRTFGPHNSVVLRLRRVLHEREKSRIIKAMAARSRAYFLAQIRMRARMFILERYVRSVGNRPGRHKDAFKHLGLQWEGDITSNGYVQSRALYEPVSPRHSFKRTWFRLRVYGAVPDIYMNQRRFKRFKARVVAHLNLIEELHHLFRNISSRFGWNIERMPIVLVRFMSETYLANTLPRPRYVHSDSNTMYGDWLQAGEELIEGGDFDFSAARRWDEVHGTFPTSPVLQHVEAHKDAGRVQYRDLGHDREQFPWLDLDITKEHNLDHLMNHPFWRVVESLMCLVGQLSELSRTGDPKSVFDQSVMAFQQFIRAATGKSIMALAYNMSQKLGKMLSDLGDQVQSGESDYVNPFTILTKAKKNWSLFCTHPVVKKIKTIFHYVVGTCFLSKMGIEVDEWFFEKAEVEALKKNHSSKRGFVFSVIDGVTHILERLYDVYKTGSWNAMLHNGDEYATWAEDVYRVKEDKQKLQNPEACGINLHEFLSRLDRLLEKGELISKYAGDLDPAARLATKRLMSELRLVKSDMLTRSAAKELRDAPFCVLVFGGSSIGKTTISEYIYQYLAQVLDQPVGPDHIYYRCAQDEYWSGFTSSVWCIVIDDIAQGNPDLEPDKSVAEVIQIANSVSFCPPQAAIEDKGRTPMRPELLIGTTNVKNLMASSYLMSELALRRRFPYVITPFVREEYCKMDGDTIPSPYDRQLDPMKVPPVAPGELSDLWTFKIEKIGVAKSQYPLPQKATEEAVFIDGRKADDLSIYELLTFLGKENKRHKVNQEAAKSSRGAMAQLEVCRTCCEIGTSCTCIVTVGDHVQSEEIPYFLFFCCMFLSTFCGYLLRKQFDAADSTIRRASNIAYQTFVNPMSTLREKMVRSTGKFVVDAAKASFWNASTRTISSVRETVETVACPILAIRSRLQASHLPGWEQLGVEREQVVRQFRQYGDGARKRFIDHPVLTGLLVMIPMAYMAYKVMNPLPDVQGSREGLLDVRDEKPNPWYRDDYEPSAFQVGRKGLSWKALTPEYAEEQVGNNCLHIAVRYERDGHRMVRPGRVFGLCGSLYVTNNHNLPEKDLEVTVTYSRAGAGITENFKFSLYEPEIFRVPECDLAFFRINNRPPVKDLTGMIPSESFSTVSSGCLINRTQNGLVGINRLSGIRRDRVYVPSHERSYVSWQAFGASMTSPGECGSVMLAHTTMGPQILGLHQTGGVSLKQTSVSLTRELVEKARTHFNLTLVQGGPPNLKDQDGVPIIIGELSLRSPFRFIEEGNASVYGSFQGFRPKHVSKVTDTYIRDVAEEHGYEVKTGKPVMKGWKPWHKAILDTVGQDFSARQYVIDECVDAFATDILASLGKEQLEEIIVLANTAVVNGQPGVRFIDKMNRKSSMGFPWRKQKRNFLSDPVQFDLWEDFVDFDEKFYGRVAEIEACYASGTRYMPVYIGHLKDEATKFKKILDAATRMFCGGPADHGFVVRKYLLTFVRVMQNNRFLFEAAPGTNCMSGEWDDLFHYLTQHGSDRIIAGDFSRFDKKMSAQWILAAFAVIDRILLAAGWSTEQRKIVQCIAYDTAFPVVDVNGDLVEFWGSNPSGHPLTVIINSLVNALYMRYVWRMLGKDLGAFKQSVALMTYGDDNVMGVSEHAPEFNHTSIQKELAKIGVVYTMADKDSESVPYVKISDVSFLKRRWRYDTELNAYLAELEEDSIAKMLTKCIPSKAVCKEQQAVDLLHGALYEYFFYGRERFDDRRTLFLKFIQLKDLHAYYVQEFPTFDELVERYTTENRNRKPEWVVRT